MSEPYTRAEIEAILGREANALPQRGQFCPRCGNHIPEFADITPHAEAELKRMVREGWKGGVAAVRKELRELTGCSEAWAKLWMIHLDGPHEADPPPIPCPRCGKLLRTGRAQQCLSCGADWHNKTPNNA
jgi:hypothetical protein